MSDYANKGERFVVTEVGEEYIRQFKFDHPDCDVDVFCAGEVVVANESGDNPYVVRERDFGEHNVKDEWSLSVGDDLERI